MTKNIRERIKERSENKIQNGGFKIIPKARDTEQKKKELKAGMALAWKVFKIYLQELINYIHFKLRPLFNLYLNWGEVFEQNSISSSEVIDKLKKKIRDKEIKINVKVKENLKVFKRLNKAFKNKIKINELDFDLKIKKINGEKENNSIDPTYILKKKNELKDELDEKKKYYSWCRSWFEKYGVGGY